MSSDWKKSQQRAFQYWFVDGWTELGLGLFCLLLGGFFWLQGSLPWSPLSNLVFFVAVFAIGFGLRWGLQQIKERTTYPRTGYVEYKSGWGEKSRVAAAAAFALILLALMIFLVLRGPQSVVWTPAIGGLIFAFIFFGIGRQTGQYRFLFLAFFSLLSGVGFSFSGFGDLIGAATLSGLVGLVLLGFGAWTRLKYLRETGS